MIILNSIVIALWVVIGIMTYINIQADRNSMEGDNRFAYNYLAYQFYFTYFMLMMELIINAIIKF